MTSNPAPQGVQTFHLGPFDLMLHYDEEAIGVFNLQRRFTGWLRSLNTPARFVCWQVPADLGEKIGQVAQVTAQADPRRQLGAASDAFARC